MQTKNFNTFVSFLIFIACIAEHPTYLLDLPEELRDKQYLLKSDERSGSIFFYSSRILIHPAINIGNSNHAQWDFYQEKTNFMAFRSTIKVTINSEEKYVYKCWLYKRENSSLYFFFPMTNLYEGQRVYLSPDDNLDICDFCTHTNTKLYLLHKEEVQCGCTPDCSELTIANSCTGNNFDTSSINCLSETSMAATLTTTIQGASSEEYSENVLLTTSPTQKSEKTTAASTILDLESTTLTEKTTQATTITTSESIILTTSVTEISWSTTNSIEESTEIKTTKNQENTIVSTIRQTNNSKIDPDALVGIVSGSVVFLYLAAALIGCGCCLFILGRRRKRAKKEKESQENLVSNEMFSSQINLKSPVNFPPVFDRIDESY
ncbi:uncharacterized protein LOC134238734 [Saccostrea cucullata]|uniref:uncharacterized protein LOC134238734 n=1 Tax=Saccostrea cuccullata TaxID=36930 RepID=UPI002ED65A9E